MGVDQFEEAIRCCQERGLTPGMVAADIEHWQARRAQWEKPLGVLYQRLKSGLDWIAPSEAWQAAQNRKARDAERAKQSQRMEAERRQRAQEKAEEDKLERDFGRVLDGLAKEDRDRLAAVVCADKPYLRSAYERGDWKADGDSVWLRSELLKTLREEWQQRPRAVPA